MDFGWCKGRRIEVNFQGGNITSDAGVLLLRKVDQRLQLTQRIAKVLNDPRIKKYSKHSILSMLRQLVYGIALGYEDLNDHDQIRNDMILQTAVGCNENLASSPTLCRFENWINKKALTEMSKILVQTFIKSYKKPPKELVLDFDGTDDKVHGKQIGGLYHGYYRHRCFLLLYVFCGEHLLVAYLRPGNVPDSKHSAGIFKLLTKELRKHWPNVSITFRADAGFCRHTLFSWCERNNVGYVTGISSDNRIKAIVKSKLSKLEKQFDRANESQVCFSEFNYSARTWKKQRRIIMKAERNTHRLRTRYLVTN